MVNRLSTEGPRAGKERNSLPQNIGTVFPAVAALDRPNLNEAPTEKRFGNVVGAVRKMTRHHARNVLRFHPGFFSDKEVAGRHFDTTARTHARSILGSLPGEGGKAVQEALRAVDSPDIPPEERGSRFTAMLQNHPNLSKCATAASLATFLFGAGIVTKPKTAEAEWSPAQQVAFDPVFASGDGLNVEDGYATISADGTSGSDFDSYFCLENGGPLDWICEAIPGLDVETAWEGSPTVMGGYLYITDPIMGNVMKYPWDGTEITGAGIELVVPVAQFPHYFKANETLGILVYTGGSAKKLYYLDPDDSTNPLNIPVLSPDNTVLQDMEGATLSEDGQTLYFAQTCSSPHGGMTCSSGIKIFKAAWDEDTQVFRAEALYDTNLNPGTVSALNFDPALSWDNAKISLASGAGGTYLSVMVTTTTTSSTGEVTTTTTTTTISIPTTTSSTSTTSPTTTTTAPSVTTTTTTITTTTSSTGHTTTTMTTTSVPTSSSSTTSTNENSDDDTNVDDDSDDDATPLPDDDGQTDDDGDGGGGDSSGGCCG